MVESEPACFKTLILFDPDNKTKIQQYSQNKKLIGLPKITNFVKFTNCYYKYIDSNVAHYNIKNSTQFDTI